ncbi:hypothetical protein CW755_17130 [Geobacillus thermodenitrificans]|jgi:hypothetical protein|uniref:ABC transporter permease n=2 Tax=Anoxybacillaceae TaxID=3120669 RepID=A0AAX1ZX19_9BACL|nr:hypothetical protein GTHT12_03237 [Geobacillus thermodenitrificans]KQB94696.1 hypothetical protein GEPA3_0327 [Geobacillus sp. PA-3]PTR45815.1 hypothetical protein CW755_17130 [Geobacillus thermodenitrificans]RWU08018.1 hypothetical protein EA138_12795 [Anoxybacillus flavithermus]TCL51212.1 hypothetical protein EDD69_104268 [Thermolongibacillus altinsuensis]
MKALLWKEYLFLKKKMQKMLLLIAIEFVLVLYFIYGLNSIPIHIKFNLILGTTSIIFLLQILFESIKTDKQNRVYEKMLQIFSIQKILIVKVLFSVFIATILSSMYSFLFYGYQLYLGIQIPSQYLLSLLLLPFINLLFGIVLCVVMFLVDNIVILKVTSMFGAMFYVLTFTNIHRYKIIGTIIGILLFLVITLHFLLKKISNEKFLTM